MSARQDYLAALEGRLDKKDIAELRRVMMGGQGGPDQLVSALAGIASRITGDKPPVVKLGDASRISSEQPTNADVDIARELALVRRWGATEPGLIGACQIDRVA